MLSVCAWRGTTRSVLLQCAWNGTKYTSAPDVDEMALTDPSETRTKESNICASLRVSNHWGGMIVIGERGVKAPHHRPIWNHS